MSEHQESRSYSPSAHITYIEPKWTSALALIISGIALGLSIWATIAYSRDYRQLEREYRLQRLEIDEMNVRLALANIPSHQKGDSP